MWKIFPHNPARKLHKTRKSRAHRMVWPVMHPTPASHWTVPAVPRLLIGQNRQFLANSMAQSVGQVLGVWDEDCKSRRCWEVKQLPKDSWESSRGIFWRPIAQDFASTILAPHTISLKWPAIFWLVGSQNWEHFSCLVNFEWFLMPWLKICNNFKCQVLKTTKNSDCKNCKVF